MAKSFIEFYFGCRPGTVETECQRVYGTDLENLEKAFWADAERLAGSQLSPKEVSRREVELGKTAQEADGGRATKDRADTRKSGEPVNRWRTVPGNQETCSNLPFTGK
jgi:hypothetical protein